jgi:hypothetical protein
MKPPLKRQISVRNGMIVKTNENKNSKPINGVDENVVREVIWRIV